MRGPLEGQAQRHEFVDKIRSFIDSGVKVTVEHLLDAIDRHEDTGDQLHQVLISAQRRIHT